ncbi:MAG: hypothetical protein ACRYG7_46515 [Janthinobacterium lividum]
MATPSAPVEQSLFPVILHHALRAEALALEGLRLQALMHQGLLGGEAEELVQLAETRAYHRAEAMLADLLAAAALLPTSPPGALISIP